MPEQKSHRKVFMIGGTVAVIMFGFCFAMVPLYSMICKATGISTSVPTSELLTPYGGLKEVMTPDLSRTITVQFMAVNNKGLPWDFYPKVKDVHIHPGENVKIFFHAKNTTSRDMTVQAIPSITPTESMGHFHKVECFCFKQQSLKAGESKDMALIFNLDKELPKEVKEITLAYTLFDAVPKKEGKDKT